MKEKTLPKLTRKQKGFVEDYVLTGNGTQSVLKNYDTESPRTASVMAVENLAKPSVALAVEIKQNSLKEALINQGVTPEKIAEKISVLLEATVGETQIPDVNAIDKGLKHSKDIYGVIEDNPKSPTGNTYNFIFSAEVQEKVKAIEGEIKQMLIQPHVKED